MEGSDGAEWLRHVLVTDGERIPVLFETDPPALLSGTSVQVTGVRTAAGLAVGSGEGVLAIGAGDRAALTTTASVLPNTFGDQKTVVLLVNFQDQPTQPYTIEQARSAVFGTVDGFFREASYGQTWLSGDVFGWFTIALTSTVCDGDTLAAQADAAAKTAGVDLSRYAHVVYAFQNACGGGGFGTIGGAPSRSWINKSLAVDVIAHELGHGLGLYHSHSRDCGAVVLGGTCSDFGYGHPFDTMGNKSNGHYNAFHKERLGWLGYGASPGIATVTADGTYVLDAYETAGSGPKALKIPKSTDPVTGLRTWYYVEARRASGYDGFLAGNDNVLNGVLVSTGAESSGDTSYLLDMTPASGSLNVYDWADPALAVGQTFSDPDSGATITTEWATPTQVAVSVRGAAPVTQPTAQTVTVATDQPSYTRSQTVTISARVTGNGTGVAGAPVSFRVTKSNGAVVTASGTTGSDGTAVWRLRLRKQDPVGSWQASATATGTAPPPSAATTFVVQ